MLEAEQFFEMDHLDGVLILDRTGGGPSDPGSRKFSPRDGANQPVGALAPHRVSRTLECMASLSASRIEFPAIADHLQEARDFVDDIATSFGFDEDVRYDLKLAATEAVSNAIRHGARSERDTVRMCAVEGHGMLTFCVSDHGTFLTNLANVDPLPEQGRGLAFIAHLMDQVCIRTGEDGTVVRFSKRLPETR